MWSKYQLMRILKLIILLTLSIGAQAQELPILIQKYTDGLAYNPSVSGLYGSSYDFSYQKRWTGIGEPYSMAYLGMQTPLNQGSLGASFNVFYENVNFLQTVDLSAGLAYHILLDNDMVVSLGLNGEYANTSLDINNIEVNDINDPALINFNNLNKLDFSFGANFRSNFFQFGASANRLLTLLRSEEDFSQSDLAFREFFTAYAVGFLPVASGRDLVELRGNYRRLLNEKNLIDLGVFYEYNRQFMLGFTYRSNSSIHAAASITLMNNLTIGYARELVVGEFSGQLGASDEITLRYTFDQVQSILNNVRGRSNTGLGSIGGSINRLRINNRSSNSNFSKRQKRVKKNFRKFTGPKKRKKKKFLGIF